MLCHLLKIIYEMLNMYVYFYLIITHRQCKKFCIDICQKIRLKKRNPRRKIKQKNTQNWNQSCIENEKCEYKGVVSSILKRPEIQREFQKKEGVACYQVYLVRENIV